MKALIQRVSEASVTVEGRQVAAMGHGVLVLLGVTQTDSVEDAAWIARKLVALRIFEDEQGLMNRALPETGGTVLVVSQFTLYADTRKGNRPSFTRAACSEQAEPLYRDLVRRLRVSLGDAKVLTGIFGATMQVGLINDGPVTLEVCSDTRVAPRGDKKKTAGALPRRH